MKSAPSRYFWAVIAVGINPLVQVSIALLVTQKLGIIGFGQYAVLAATYSTLCVIGRLTNWQHVLMDLQVSYPSSAGQLCRAHMRMDLVWAAVSGLAFLGLNWAMGNPVGSSKTALSFALAGLVYNSGVITGILRFHDKHKWIAVAGMISLTAKVSWIHWSAENPADIALQVSMIDLMTWCGLLAASRTLLHAHRCSTTTDLPLGNLSSFRDKISLYASGLLALPTQHLDKILLSTMLSPVTLGTYALVQRFTALFSLISESLGSVLFKRINAQPGSLMSRSAQIRITLIGCALFLPPLTIMLSLLPLLDVRLFAGQLADHYLSVGLFYTSFAFASGLFWVHLLAVIRLDARAFLATTVISTVAYLVLLFPLTRWLSINGALLALTVQYVIVIGSRLWLLRRH